MENLMVFENELFGKVRTITSNEGKPYFVAKDIAVVLGYKKARKSSVKTNGICGKK